MIIRSPLISAFPDVYYLLTKFFKFEKSCIYYQLFSSPLLVALTWEQFILIVSLYAILYICLSVQLLSFLNK